MAHHCCALTDSIRFSIFIHNKMKLKIKYKKIWWHLLLTARNVNDKSNGMSLKVKLRRLKIRRKHKLPVYVGCAP